MEEKENLNVEAGGILKDAIKKYHKTQLDVAKEIGITTKQLQNYSKGKFPQYKSESIKKIDKLLNTNLFELIYDTSTAKPAPIGNVVPIGDPGSDDFKEKYYSQLEENNKILKDQITTLTALVRKVEKNLDDALRNQITLVAMNSAFQKMFVNYLGEQKDHDPQTLLRNLHRDTVEKMKAYEKMGSFAETDI